METKNALSHHGNVFLRGAFSGSARGPRPSAMRVAYRRVPLAALFPLLLCSLPQPSGAGEARPAPSPSTAGAGEPAGVSPGAAGRPAPLGGRGATLAGQRYWLRTAEARR